MVLKPRSMSKVPTKMKMLLLERLGDFSGELMVQVAI